MKQIQWRQIAWFMSAAMADVVIRQIATWAEFRWLHLSGLAFVVVLRIGIQMGREDR